jgi:hypothetical protein
MLRPALALSTCLLAACQLPWNETCACTTDYRANACVTLDGKPDIPEGVTLYRFRRDGAIKDTLFGGNVHSSHGIGNCFGEDDGPYRIEVWKDGAKAAERRIGKVPAVDCCHNEPITIDFVL